MDVMVYNDGKHFAILQGGVFHPIMYLNEQGQFVFQEFDHNELSGEFQHLTVSNDKYINYTRNGNYAFGKYLVSVSYASDRLSHFTIAEMDMTIWKVVFMFSVYTNIRRESFDKYQSHRIEYAANDLSILHSMLAFNIMSKIARLED